MNIQRHFEAYRIKPEGKMYRIENFDADENNHQYDKSLKSERTNEIKESMKNYYKEKNDSIKYGKKENKKKSSILDLMKSKFKLFKDIRISKRGLSSLKINEFIFGNVEDIYNFLFRGKKSVSGIDVLKLRKLFSLIGDSVFRVICKSARKILKK